MTISSKLIREVDSARYQADLLRITGIRPPGTPHWRVVQNLCADRLRHLGYSVELQHYGTGVNVIGRRDGVRKPSEQVLLSAHYDGTPDCPGADDNATGVAGVLEAARVLAMQEHDRTLVVACWDEEETGLIGSDAYAVRARERGDDIKITYVFEMIGYRSDAPGSQTLPAGLDLAFPKQVRQIRNNESRGDFIAVVRDEKLSSAQAVAHFEYVGEKVGLPVVTLPLTKVQKNSAAFSDLRRSDHASFWQAGFPALMVTDTANFRNTHYHCGAGPDTADRLDAEFAAKIIRATVGSVAQMLRCPHA